MVKNEKQIYEINILNKRCDNLQKTCNELQETCNELRSENRKIVSELKKYNLISRNFTLSELFTIKVVK